MKVAVLTTSYPRHRDDVAGTFVRDAVEALRAEGVEVDVVSPASFRHYGIAYGHGIAGNLRRSPWRVLALPLFLASYALAARRVARDADVVLAHWLPSAIPAIATRRPFLLHVWGTDVALARRAPRLFGLLARRARAVIAPSDALARDARSLDARRLHVIPPGVRVPSTVATPDDPPHVLFVGRLAPEKGIEQFLRATDGIARVVVGDGPLRAAVPDGAGFVPPDRVPDFFARASVVCVPSLREGYGFTAREAMAHGRAVVASSVGGLVDAVTDRETGLLVPPGDAARLREAIELLLADAGLRAALGDAARAHAREHFSVTVAAKATISALEEARRPS